MFAHRNLKRKSVFSIRLICAAFLLFQMTLYAQGSLMIFPSRVVFEGNQRFEVLGVTNVGADTTTYVLSFVQYRMTETGGFEEISEPDSNQKFAHDYVRFFPRQVALPPQETQSVRVQLRKPADLPPGEYRSHLSFRSVPKSEELGAIQGGSDDGKFSFELAPIYGITIPVIVRHNAERLELQIKNAQLEELNGQPFLAFDCYRDGNISAYFDIKATYVSPQGDSFVLLEQKGFAIYTPNMLRKFNIPVRSEGQDLSSGKIVLELMSGSDLKDDLLARVEIDLAG